MIFAASRLPGAWRVLPQQRFEDDLGTRTVLHQGLGLRANSCTLTLQLLGAFGMSDYPARDVAPEHIKERVELRGNNTVRRNVAVNGKNTDLKESYLINVIDPRSHVVRQDKYK